MKSFSHRLTRVKVVCRDPNVAVSEALCESENHQSYASTLFYAAIKQLTRQVPVCLGRRRMDKKASTKPSDVTSKNPNKMIRHSLATQMLDE
jgi:hypothetical protein